MVDLVQGVKDYWNDVPQNTPIQMVYAAGAGFIIRTITSGDMRQGASAAGLSALATLIHGLISPLFKKLTDGRVQLSFGEEFCRSMTAIIAAGAIAKAFKDDSIIKGLPGIALLYAFITFMNPGRRDVNQADWIPLFPTHSLI